MKKYDPKPATITGITKKGYTIADIGTKNIEVPYGCPGEAVVVQQFGRKKADIVDITKPSPHRIPVRCLHAGDKGRSKGKCGGCAFQYIDYQYQLELKRGLIVDTFAQHNITADILPAIASPKVFQYRNRMDYAVGEHGELGLRSKGAWYHIVDVQECHIVSSNMEAVRKGVVQWIKEKQIQGWNGHTHEGFLRYVVIRETSAGDVGVIFITYQENLDKHITDIESYLPEHVTHIFNGINNSEGEVSILDAYQAYKGTNQLKEIIYDVPYYIAPGSFFQTNTYAATTLLDLVLKWVDACNPQHILDLYCGSGFFALQLAKKYKHVVGVELDAQAIERAQQSWDDMKNSYDSGVSFIASDAIDYTIDPIVDTLIVDPPRTGLHPQALAEIIQAQPEHIIYVSCNFTTLTQNLVDLEPYYTIEQVQPIDLFPHTPHIETVVKLTRKKTS